MYINDLDRKYTASSTSVASAFELGGGTIKMSNIAGNGNWTI